MTKTKIEATLAQIVRAIAALPWGELCDRTAYVLRACWVAAQLLLAAGAIAWQIACEHRAQIRQALLMTIATIWLAMRITYRAGRRARRYWAALLEFSERMGQWYASLVAPAVPEPAAPEAAPAVLLDPSVDDLTSLSCRELRELLGVNKRLSKSRLLAMAMAA